MNAWDGLPLAATLTLSGKLKALGLDFCPSAINGAWAVPAWDAINGAQAGKD